MSKPVQDLKMKIEAIEKTQTERTLEMENLGKWVGSTDSSIIESTEGRENLRCRQCDRKKMDTSVKENAKSKNILDTLSRKFRKL